MLNHLGLSAWILVGWFFMDLFKTVLRGRSSIFGSVVLDAKSIANITAKSQPFSVRSSLDALLVSLLDAVINVDYSVETVVQCLLAIFTFIASQFVWLIKNSVQRIALPLAVACFSVQLLVIVVHGILFLSCDVVELLVRTFVPKRWLGSWRWNCGCLCMWLLVLGFASPLLAELLKQPLVILWSQAGLAVIVHRHALVGGSMYMGNSELEGRSTLLSSKLYKRFGRQKSLSAIRNGNSGFSKPLYAGIWFMGLLASYVATRLQELMQTPFWFAVMGVYLMNRMVSIIRIPEPNLIQFWKLLWTVSYRPFHMADVDACEEHEQCAVCLDSLCTSVGSLAQGVGLGLHRRLAFSASRLRPRAGSGISGVRSAGRDMCKQALTGMWGRVATLPCGHKFHTGCIHDVISAMPKLLCPTCRGAFGDDWADFEPDQKRLYHLGLVAIFVFYVVVYVWNSFLARRLLASGYEASTGDNATNMTNALNMTNTSLL